MSVEGDKAKALILDVLDREFTKVASEAGRAEGVRLAVWQSRQIELGLGYEEQPNMANLWIRTALLPPSIPEGVKVTHKIWNEDLQKWASPDGTRGANSNLKYYPKQFGRDPMTRLGIKTAADAKLILDQLTKGAATRSGSNATFLLKIDGSQNAPGQICRPTAASEWEGGLITMEWNTPRASSYTDKRPGPMPQTGDLLYIWTHEDKNYGNGKGLTATAIAGDVVEGDGEISIQLRNVTLLPRPFGFREMDGKGQTTSLLQEIHAARGARAWCMSSDERAELDALIGTYGSAKAAAIAEAESRHLSELDKALAAERDEIDDAEEERKTAVVKARPNQAAFRANAMKRHEGRCVVTRMNVAAALEAAHVIPHTGNSAFEVPENSLILRRDIHALFDACLLAIHPKSNRIVISSELEGSSYAKLAGREVRHLLAPEALNYQFRRFQKALPTDIAA